MLSSNGQRTTRSRLDDMSPPLPLAVRVRGRERDSHPLHGRFAAVADTVSNAQQNPDDSQPWAELGLKVDEYARIKEILGRRPTSCELAMYSVMWSEHCS